MLKRNAKILLEKQAEIMKALAHPLRIAIAEFLNDGEKCVSDIAMHLGSKQSNVSRHLSVMVNAGLLEYRKEALKVIYRLKCRCISEFLLCIDGVLKVQARENENLLKSL